MSGVTERSARVDSGFTLVELSITLAVIGILSALAFPSFKGALPRIRLDNDTTLLANEINLVRRQAMAKSLDFGIVFNADAESYTLRKRDEATGAWSSMATNKLAGSDIVRNPDPPYGSITGFSSPDVLVAQAGGTMNVPLAVGGAVNFGYITLQTPDGSRRKRIKVEPLGRVSVQRWLGGTSWVDG